MFARIRAAYALLVEALTDHAASVRQADKRFRDFYGLEDADAPVSIAGRDDRTPIAPPADTGGEGETPAAEPDKPEESAARNGRARRPVKV
jgi:hypothetical protein